MTMYLVIHLSFFRSVYLCLFRSLSLLQIHIYDHDNYMIFTMGVYILYMGVCLGTNVPELRACLTSRYYYEIVVFLSYSFLILLVVQGAPRPSTHHYFHIHGSIRSSPTQCTLLLSYSTIHILGYSYTPFSCNLYSPIPIIPTLLLMVYQF